jgi:AraC-like DNA-binding protein
MTDQHLAVLYQIDLIVRGGSLTLLMIWSYVILRDYRAILSARIAIILNLTTIAYIMNGVLFTIAPNAPVNYVFNALSVFAPPFLWLFALTWFNDVDKIGWRRWVPVFALALIYFGQSAVISLTGRASHELWVMMRIAMFGFGAAGIWAAWQGRENDLVEVRRRFRLVMIGAIGGFVILVNMVEVLVESDVLGLHARSLIELAIFLITFAISARLYNLANPELFAQSAKILPHNGESIVPSQLAEKLTSYMSYERVYRTEGLTIAALAAQIGEQEYRLRRLINGELGFRNFTAFLNSYRLSEVRDALADPNQKDVPILIIAIDAGFGSLGPFNRAFREAEEITPSEYRARHI